LSVLTVSTFGVLVLRFAAWHSGLMDAAASCEPDGPAGDSDAADGDPDAADGEPEAAAGEPGATAGDADAGADDGWLDAGALDAGGLETDALDVGAVDVGAVEGDVAGADAAGADGAGELDAAGWLGGASDADMDAAAVGVATLAGVGVDDPPMMLQPATRLSVATNAKEESNRLRIRASSSRVDAGEGTL
jgi:hypothetical protein